MADSNLNQIRIAETEKYPHLHSSFLEVESRLRKRKKIDIKLTQSSNTITAEMNALSYLSSKVAELEKGVTDFVLKFCKSRYGGTYW